MTGRPLHFPGYAVPLYSSGIGNHMGNRNIGNLRIPAAAIILSFLLASVLFFLPLFYPQDRLFVTPDSQLSDILHFNLPFKSFLSVSLKHHSLPVWTDAVGTGFPVMAEGETGTFALTNLVLFGLFPAVTAFNLGYVLTFFLLGWGTYLALRALGSGRLLSWVGGILFMFSGFAVVQIPHYSHLQGLAMFPFMLAVTVRVMDDKRSNAWLWMPLLVSQQICYGHYQYVFMSGVTIGAYILLRMRTRDGNIPPERLATLAGASILGTALALVQLLPSFEFFANSSRTELIRLYAPSSASMTLAHLAQFADPHLLGDIRAGTYEPGGTGISFWESFSYIGVIPLLIALGSLFRIGSDRKTRVFWILTGILLLIAFESSSPFQFMFSFAPLSMFRMHSRFLAFVTFILIALFVRFTGFILTRVKGRRTVAGITVLIAVVSFADVLSFARTYNPTLKSADALAAPSIYRLLPDGGDYRYYPLYSNRVWFTVMHGRGWKRPEDYLYLKNGLMPNLAVGGGPGNIQVYSGFTLAKQTAALQYLTDQSDYNDRGDASISATAVRFLELQNAKYIVTPYTVLQDGLEKTDTLDPPREDLPSFYVYQTAHPKRKFYLAYDVKPVFTYRQFTDMLARYPAADAFITDSAVPGAMTTDVDGTVDVRHYSATDIRLSVRHAHEGYLVASVLLYPGWRAWIDGRETKLYPANLTGMAVRVPPGVHDIRLSYTSTYLGLGAILTGIAATAYLMLTVSVYSNRRFRHT